MNIPGTLTAVVASLGLALVSLPGQAATGTSHEVTQAQLDTLQTGESLTDITKTLGTPGDTPTWMDGSRSLVYDMHVEGNSPTFAYVDVDKDGKLLDVAVIERW